MTQDHLIYWSPGVEEECTLLRYLDNSTFSYSHKNINVLFESIGSIAYHIFSNYIYRSMEANASVSMTLRNDHWPKELGQH